MKKNEEKTLPRKVRGVATIADDYGIVFKPYAEGVGRKEDERKARQSSMYTTQGENCLLYTSPSPRDS